MAELKRQLGLLDSTMINVGTIIASAIFIVPSAIAATLGATGPSILVWVIGGVVSLLGALCGGEPRGAVAQGGGPKPCCFPPHWAGLGVPPCPVRRGGDEAPALARARGRGVDHSR